MQIYTNDINTLPISNPHEATAAILQWSILKYSFCETDSNKVYNYATLQLLLRLLKIRDYKVFSV